MDPTFTSRKGQFIPMAAMVIFTVVVFMIAAVNVYKVAQAKLKVQNIADTVALDIAAREASSLNWIADRNDWLNHLYANSTSPTNSANPCPNVANSPVLPGLSCVEYNYDNLHSYSFTSNTGAIAYARLVKTVNDAQTLAYQAFNSFIGADPRTGQKSLEDILRKDIKDFEDPTLRIIVWNTATGEGYAKSAAESIKQSTPGSSGPQRVVNTQYMSPMTYNIHDVRVAYEVVDRLTGHHTPYGDSKLFSQLLGTGQAAGWMTMGKNSPTLQVKVGGSQPQVRVGAGAYAIEGVKVLGQTISVSARAVAYVVPGSGQLPKDSASPSHPIFKPTYWVKLVTPYGS